MSDTTVRVRGGGTAVTIRGGSTRRVTLGQATVAKINDNRGRTVVQPRETPVGVVSRPTVVRAGGSMGPQGPRGAPGGSVPAITFGFGDAPHAVFTPDAAGVLVNARLKIDTPFDGGGAQIRVGIAGDAEAVLSAADNDPTRALEYENSPDLRMTAGQGVVLAITPGTGTTQGAGQLFLTYLPD